MAPAPLSWFGIVRLGLVQTGLGAVVVLTTSTLNRVMVVELALPAALPGALVALHYALQVLRPAFGHGSDHDARRVPWIVGGMAALCLGGWLAAVATALMAGHLLIGITLAVAAFGLIGGGVGAAGTALLVLLAERTDEPRRAAAATTVWVMMIAGFILTTALAGHWLDPFSPLRLVAVSGGVSAGAMLLTVLGIVGMAAPAPAGPSAPGLPLRAAFIEVWSDTQARRFALFVFVSMLAYSAQDLILEPFAGAVFSFSPGATTQLSGLQHAGTLAGMVLVPLIGAVFSPARRHTIGWIVAGCLASALALLGLAAAALAGPPWPLRATVFVLGVTNGAYAVAAIGAMMTLVRRGDGRRAGLRMGFWGAAQALGFGLGGFLGTLASDVAHAMLAAPRAAYAAVFVGEAALFVVAALMAIGLRRSGEQRGALSLLAAGGAR